MSQIEYSYQIIGVNAEHKSMEIVYTAEGRETIHVIAKLPLAGQPVEEVVRAWAPLYNWLAAEEQLATVEVGIAGSDAVALPAEPTDEELVLGRRGAELTTSDWTQLPDVPLTQEKRNEWAAYRQALRDITNQAGFPTTVVWPAAPQA